MQAEFRNGLDAFEVVGLDRIAMIDIASVAGCRRFKQQNTGLLMGDRLVFHSTRDDAEFANIESDDLIAEVNVDVASDHEKHLIFVGVLMPDILAFELHDLDVLAIQLAHDLGNPVLVERREFIGETDVGWRSGAHDVVGLWCLMISSICGMENRHNWIARAYARN